MLVAPRDAMGMLAVDTTTGKILWQNFFAPSQEILGLANGKLFFYAENDRYWGAVLPRRWHAAFVASGGRAKKRTMR